MLGHLGYGFLDADQVDQALAQRRARHRRKLRVLRLTGVLLTGGGRGLGRPDQANQRRLEPVLDSQQVGRHLDQQRLVRLTGAGDQHLQVAAAVLHPLAQLAQAQHAQRIADLLQHLYLWHQLLGAVHAGAQVDIQHVLDPAQVLADGTGHGLHQPDAGRAQALPRHFDLGVTGQQAGQVECLPDGHDALAVALGARDVVQQVVDQVSGRLPGIGGLALRMEPAHLAVGLAQQALDRDAGLQPLLAQRLHHAADHPPQLVHRVQRGGRLELLRHLGQPLQGPGLLVATDEPEQGELEARPQVAAQRLDVLA